MKKERIISAEDQIKQRLLTYQVAEVRLLHEYQSAETLDSKIEILRELERTARAIQVLSFD